MSDDIIARAEAWQEDPFNGDSGKEIYDGLVAELKTTRAQLRQVARQLGLFLEDGERNRVIVALAITDGTAEENDA